MKIQKLSLSGIKNVLSRDELKKIMAGSGSDVCCACWNTPNDPAYIWDTGSETCTQFCVGLGWETGTSVNTFYC